MLYTSCRQHAVPSSLSLAFSRNISVSFGSNHFAFQVVVRTYIWPVVEATDVRRWYFICVIFLIGSRLPRTDFYILKFNVQDGGVASLRVERMEL
jgi:hypothetical protein